MNTIFSTLQKPLVISALAALVSCSGASVGVSGGGGGTGLALGTGFSTRNQEAPGVIEYRDQIKSIVQRNLIWNGKKVSDPVALNFQISELGAVSDISKRSSSGDTNFDQAATEALERSSPLPAPPETVYKSFHYIRITVDGPK